MEIKIYVNARFLTQKLTGVQRFAIEISKWLKIQLPQIQFIAPANIIQSDIAAELQVTLLGKNTGVRWEQFDLPLFLRKQGNPLLINLANTAPLLYPNQIVTIHDLAFKINPKWFSKSFSTFYNFLIPRIVKRAKHIITVSNFSKLEIISNYNVKPETVSVIYNAIVPFTQSVINNKLFDNYILCVGSIDKRKNLNVLISAFKQLNQGKLALVICGDQNAIFGDNPDYALQADNIHFTGRVSDDELAHLYANAFVFVYPSLYEGFGIPPLEAMYFNCPTIVSDIPSLNEVCADASLYFNPRNDADLCEKINILLEQTELRESLINKGKTNLTRFSWKTSAQNLVNIIDNIKD